MVCIFQLGMGVYFPYNILIKFSTEGETSRCLKYDSLVQAYPFLKALSKLPLVSVKPRFSSLSSWRQWEFCSRSSSRGQRTLLWRVRVLCSLLLKLGGGKLGVLLLIFFSLCNTFPSPLPSKHLAQISVILFDRVQKEVPDGCRLFSSCQHLTDLRHDFCSLMM